MLDVKKPENSCSICLNHRIHYDVVQDVCGSDLKHQFSHYCKSDDIRSYDKKRETIAKKQSENTCQTDQRETKGMSTEEPQIKKRKRESEHTITHPKKAILVDDQVTCNSPIVCSENEMECNIIITNTNLN